MADEQQLIFDFEFVFEPVALAYTVQKERAAPGRKAEFVPFPLARRRPLISKLVEEVATASTASAAENLLHGRLARLARGLTRKHISVGIIAAELQALEAVVRDELMRRPAERLARG